MKRTPIVLPDEPAFLLDRERGRRGVSAAAIVREALDACFDGHRDARSFIGRGRSGFSHTARDMEAVEARGSSFDSTGSMPTTPGSLASSEDTDCGRP